MKKMLGVLVCACLATLPGTALGQGKTKVKLTLPEVKQILEELEYECKIEKSQDGKTDVCRVSRAPKTYVGRIQLFDDGATLAIDVQFPGAVDKISLSSINTWNVHALLTRAVLLEEKTATGKIVKVPQLEADLDCGGGVTSRTVARFIRRFEEKGQEFGAFLAKALEQNLARPGDKNAPANGAGLTLTGTIWKGKEDLEGYGDLAFEFKPQQ